MMKIYTTALATSALFIFAIQSVWAQLSIKGTVYSESIARVTFHSDENETALPVYLYPPKQEINDGDTILAARYEAPIRFTKGHNYYMLFTDGTVQKLVYVSGAVPEGISPKQKFQIDISLIDPTESDMTLIVFWSVSQRSYRALPLSRINEIRTDAPEDFFWNDGSEPEKGKLKSPF